MTEVIAVAALRNAAINRLTSILQTCKVLLGRGWPKILLLGTLMIGRQAPGDRVLLVQITLEVHVGVGQSELLLHTDKVDVHVLGPKRVLELDVGCIRGGLDVLHGGLLNIVEVALIGGSLQLGPSNLSRDVGDVGAINLARILAIQGYMTCDGNYSVKIVNASTIACLPSCAQLLQTLGGAVGQSAAR